MVSNSYNFYEKQLRDGKNFSGRKWKYSYGCTVKPHSVSKKKKKNLVNYVHYVVWVHQLQSW